MSWKALLLLSLLLLLCHTTQQAGAKTRADQSAQDSNTEAA